MVDYLVVAGPTASGKSQLAMRLAQDLSGEIINCDSVQLYKGFDIGSAKPTDTQRKQVKHHLVDYLSGDQDFDAKQYGKLGRQAIEAVLNKGMVPIVVGGTGLYLRSLWQKNFHNLPTDSKLRFQLSSLSNEELQDQLIAKDPERASQIHGNDRLRLLRALELVLLLKHPISELPVIVNQQDNCFKIIVDLPRFCLHRRIEQRVQVMLDQGLVAETEGLLKAFPNSCKPLASIGYKQVCQYLNGEIPLERLAEKIVFATRQYAKRQCTWFKKETFDYHYNPDQQYNLLISQIRLQLT